MRKKGFVSLLLLAAFIPAYFYSASLCEEVLWRSESANEKIIGAEKALIVRTELEENTDFIIERTLAEHAGIGSTPEKAKEEIARRLISYYEDEALERGQSVSFWNSGFSGSDYSQLLFQREKSPLAEHDLKSESAVTITRAGNAVEAEFVFTGGLLRDRQAFAIIEAGNARMVFVIPRNYTARMVLGIT